jgi:hypothetical protein
MTGTPGHRSRCTLSARLLLGVGILLTGVLPDWAEEALSSRRRSALPHALRIVSRGWRGTRA